MLFLLIALMAFYTVVPLGVVKCVEMRKNNERRIGGFVSAIVVVTCLFAGTMFSLFNTNAITIDNANDVAIVPIDAHSRSTNARLYYDEDTDEYFTITIDWWNPLNPTQRYAISEADATNYINQAKH